MSNLGRRRKKNNSEGGAPEWMQTYSDMVTLLLCFFILLFSLSVVDIERFRTILASVQVALSGDPGVLEGYQEPEPEVDPPAGEDIEMDYRDFDMMEMMEMMELLEEAHEVKGEVADFLEDMGLEDEVELGLEDRGVVMDLPDTIFFEIGRAELRPEAQEVSVELAELLRDMEYDVIIEGHTCDLPIQTERFPDNWELSVARSAEVVRFLVYEEELSPDRFRATGYGEYQPRVPNETEEKRAQNRRVTIVISVF